MTIELADYFDGDVLLEAGIARPAAGVHVPAVLIAPQWSGRGEIEHAAAERLAALGYVGIAIDMFGKGVKGSPGGDNSALIGPWMADRAALQRRVLAAVTFAKTLPGVDATRIAAIGYCFGGLCVLDLARAGGAHVRGVVSLHGLLNGNEMPSSGPMTAKVLLEHGWLDPMANPEQVLAFAEEMKTRDADWQLHAHGGAMHAFTIKGANDPSHGAMYDPDADRRSWQSAVLFLRDTLTSQT